MGGKSGSDRPVTIGYQYFLSMHLALCHGPVDSINTIKAGDIAVVWKSGQDSWVPDSGLYTTKITSNGSFSFNKPDLFGGKLKEGGAVGSCLALMGGPTQLPNEWLRTALGGPTALPAFRGITSIVWQDIFYGSNSAIPKPWQVHTTRIPLKFLTGVEATALGTALYADILGEANPAFIVAECLIDSVWGLGYAWADLNLASFATAAAILHAEGFGLSALWESSSTTEDFLNLIMQHCSGTLYVAPDTGQFTFKLIRKDYNVLSLFVANETNVVDMSDMTRTGTAELVNQVTVKWVDVNTGNWNSLTVNNPAVRELQKSIVAVTREYVAVTSSTLAKTIALRDISVMSQPLASVKLIMNRTASHLSIGDVIEWVWPDLGIGVNGSQGMLLRIVSIGYGLLDSSEITLDCIEDIFGANHVNYSTPNDTAWVDPTPNAAVVPAQRSFNPTYMDVLQHLRFEGNSITDLTPDRGFNILLASQPSRMATNYELWVDRGTASYAYNKLTTFNPYAKITTTVSPADFSTFAIYGSLSPDWIKVGQYAICGEEWMYVSAVSTSAVGVTTLTCTRGIIDTTPGFLYADADIWFYDKSQTADYKDFVTGTIVHSKALTRTSLGLLPLVEAPVSTNTIDARWMRPYPPANLKINGSRFPATVTGDVSLTWSYRNRTLQELTVLGQNESATISDEVGTTYTVRIISPTDVVLKTYEGIVGNIFIYSQTQAIADGANGSFYIGIVAVRNGLASQMAHFSAIQSTGFVSQANLVDGLGLSVYDSTGGLVTTVDAAGVGYSANAALSDAAGSAILDAASGAVTTSDTTFVSTDLSLRFPPFGAYTPSILAVADHIIVTSINAIGDAGVGFSGKDAIIYWTDNHVALFTAPTKFSVEEQHGWLKDYEVVISKDGVVRRTEYVLIPEYTYTYDKNVADGLTRRFTVTIRIRNDLGIFSPGLSASMENPAAVFSQITFMPKSSSGALLVHAVSTDPQLRYTKVYASKTSGFIPSDINLAYQGADTIMTVPTPGGGVWFIKLMAVDDFGEFGAIVSAELTPDVIPPGPPTQLTVKPMIRSVLLQWMNPSDVDFDHVEIFMGLDSNFSGNGVNGSAAGKVGNSTSDSYTITGLPVSMVTRYFWVRAVDKTGNISAFNTVVGTSGTTLEEADFMVALLAGKLSESALTTALGTRLNLIDGAASVAGSVANQVAAEAAARGTAISNERTVWQAADSQLAQSISLITASSSTGFDAGQTWYFDATVEGWTAAGATQAWSAGYVNVTATGSTPQFTSPAALSVVGTQYNIVKIRVKRLAGTGWIGNLFYSTSGHGLTAPYGKNVPVPAVFGVGDIAIIDFDMSLVTDWTSNIITQIRLDLGSTGDIFAVDWVAIGRNAPASAVAGLSVEQTARISGDAATLASATALNTTLSAQVNDVTTGLPATRSTLVALSTTVSNLSTSTSSSISSLSAQLNTPGTGLVASVAAITTAQQAMVTPATVQATVDTSVASSVPAAVNTALANSTTLGASVTAAVAASTIVAQHTSSINGLSGQYTVKIDNNGYVAGYGLASIAADPTAVPSSAFKIRADQFTIGNPSGPGVAPVTPFMVITTPTVINGSNFAPGTYINNAMIANLKAGQISTTDLSSINSNLGTIVAGVLRSADGLFVIDLNQKFISIQ
jgi:hypothetical protein